MYIRILPNSDTRSNMKVTPTGFNHLLWPSSRSSFHTKTKYTAKI